MKIRIYIGGNFDCLHSGHINLLKYAHSIPYAHVIVSLNTDEFAEEYKRKPVMPLSERIAVLEACAYVDEVIINTGGKDSKPAILEAKANVILHGSDWQGDELMKQMGLTQEWLDEHEIQMIYADYTEGISTTFIIERMKLIN